MREMLEQTVIARFKNGLDECDTHGWGEDPRGPWENPDGTAGYGRYVFYLNMLRYESLRAKRITIEQYVSMLNDVQLLAAYDSQCCQQYR